MKGLVEDAAFAAAGMSMTSDPVEWAACRDDPVRCVSKWFKVYEPRDDVKFVPFALWERQAEWVEWYRSLRKERARGVTVKCRDVGFSWLVAAMAVHGWLFEPGFAFVYGSYKEDKVDVKGNPSSWFEKVRFIIRNLPEFLKPPGFDEKWMQVRNVVNHANGASIVGEIGDEMGRGSRGTVYVADEFAFVERSEVVEAAVSHAAHTIVFGSTPRGVGNAFFRKAHDPSIKKFSFKWHDNPNNARYTLEDGTEGQGYPGPPGATYPYYELQRSQLTPSKFAEEVLADFYASTEDALFDGKWIESCMTFDPKKHGWTPRGPVVAGIDLAAGGANKTQLAVRRGPTLVAPIVESSESDGAKIARMCYKVCRRLKVEALVMDGNGVGKSAYDAMMALDPPFVVVNFNGGAAATKRAMPGNVRASDVYANRRTEEGFRLRERAQKTHELVSGIKKHPVEECLAICGNQKVATGMAVVRYEETAHGKYALRSKKSMKKESIVLDSFDAVMMAFAVDGKPRYGLRRLV